MQDHTKSLQYNKDAKILESSSGNTIKALGAIANTFGIASKTISNRINIQEQKDILMWM
jgi:cysteine synthase